MTNKVFAYVGSYTVEREAHDRYVTNSKGIEVFSVNSETGEWVHIQTVEQLNPMYLLLDHKQQTLYATSSDSHLVYSYRRDSQNGMLTPLNNVEVEGLSTLCMDLSKTGKHLVVGAMSGHISSIEINADGSLGRICDEFRLLGDPGPLREAQPWPRPHHSVFDPVQNLCYIVDKGNDCVYTEYVDENTGKLKLLQTLQTRPGGCARHIVFHPNGRFAYINTEYIGTVIACRWDSARGLLMPFQILPTSPEDYVGNYCLSSEIQIHPSGRFLYVSNRGDNSIGIFSVNLETGKLKTFGWRKTGGTIPRYFCIAPRGKYLYVGNQGTGDIKSFAIDQKTGDLTYTGQNIRTSTPVWIIITDQINHILNSQKLKT